MNKYKVLVLSFDKDGNENGQTEYEVFGNSFELKERSSENDSECHYFYYIYGDSSGRIVNAMFDAEVVAGIFRI